MTPTLFLFVGQGVELPWVTAELLGDSSVAPLIELASDRCDVDVARLLTRGGRQIERSAVVQPAMVAVSLGVHRMLERVGQRPTMVLGHSLGELTAWAAAGGITAEDAVELAALRGNLMDREAARCPGGMLQIIGDRDMCERAISIGSRAGWMCLAAHNGPAEWVVSGSEVAIAAVVAEIRALRLPVSGAWHSPAMAGACDELTAALNAVARRPMRVPLIANRDGTCAADDSIPELLAGQLVRPVQWVAAMRTVDDAKVQRFVAVGPGKSLRALVQRNLGLDRQVEIIDSARALAAAAAR